MTNTVKTAKKTAVPAATYIRKAPDAIMAEVWRIKAQINAEASYSVDKILERARQIAVQQSHR